MALDNIYIFTVVNLIASIIIIIILADITDIVMINIIIINIIIIVIYMRVVKSSNSKSKSNEETPYAGYYVDKNTHKKAVFSLIFDVIIRLEFNLDLISE